MTTQYNKHVFARLEGIQQALIAHYNGGSTLPNAVKGSERETFIGDFLKQLFPSPFRFGSGVITDNTGACSGQIDIVVEYPFLPSFPMPGGSNRLYLAESVAVVLEVKSNLSAQWSQVENSVRKIRNIKRRWQGFTQQTGSKISVCSGVTFESLIPIIAVGYTGYHNIESLKQRLNETPEESRPYCAFVIDSGVFVRPGCEASSALGLFGLAVVITECMNVITTAKTNIEDYVCTDNI